MLLPTVTTEQYNEVRTYVPQQDSKPMRISPNFSRLRMIALSCWILGTWWMFQSGHLKALSLPPLLVVGEVILATIIFTVGVVFWLLGNDRRAGVTFDRKGLSLNLGSSASFVAWDNIAKIGLCRRRMSLFALGSHSQLGITLRDPAVYLQSYETRLPSGRGLIVQAVRALKRLMRREQIVHEPTLAVIEAQRHRTGYDIVIPEAQLGGSARAFIALIEAYQAGRG